MSSAVTLEPLVDGQWCWARMSSRVMVRPDRPRGARRKKRAHQFVAKEGAHFKAAGILGCDGEGDVDFFVSTRNNSKARGSVAGFDAQSSMALSFFFNSRMTCGRMCRQAEAGAAMRSWRRLAPFAEALDGFLGGIERVKRALDLREQLFASPG